MDGPGQPGLVQPERFYEITLPINLLTLVQDLQGLQECCLRLHQLLTPLLLPCQLQRNAALESRAFEPHHVVLHRTVALFATLEPRWLWNVQRAPGLLCRELLTVCCAENCAESYSRSVVPRVTRGLLRRELLPDCLHPELLSDCLHPELLSDYCSESYSRYAEQLQHV